MYGAISVAYDTATLLIQLPDYFPIRHGGDETRFQTSSLTYESPKLYSVSVLEDGTASSMKTYQLGLGCCNTPEFSGLSWALRLRRIPGVGTTTQDERLSIPEDSSTNQHLGASTILQRLSHLRNGGILPYWTTCERLEPDCDSLTI